MNNTFPSVARLIVTRGPNVHQEYTLPQHDVSLGRSANSEIVFGDPEVSRHHAQISCQQGAYFVADWGSTNGTFVNGQRVIGQTRLQDGDEIELGDAVRLVFYQAAPHNAAEPPPQSAGAAAETQLDFAAGAWAASPEQTPRPSNESPSEPAVGAAVGPEPDPWPEAPPRARSSRRMLLGCGCLVIALAFLCAATLFFLDGYQQGRLLYCGGLRPFWETLLGPIGFAPVCP